MRVDDNKYFENLNKNQLIDDLKIKGFSFLPPINKLNCFNEVLYNSKNELRQLTYKENSSSHLLLEESIDLKNTLEPLLLDLARDDLGYKGSSENRYKISRHVKPGKSSEAYRSHFDSHIFTIVFPILIPITEEEDLDGSLVVMPNLRDDTSNEIINFSQKAYYKRYANRNGLISLKNKNVEYLNVKFHDYRPMIFLGRTTFHCNYPLSPHAESSRITFLSHLYDRESTFGIGNILRKLRSR